MKLDKAMIAVLIAVLISMGATQIVYFKYTYPSYKSLPMFVETTNKLLLGINTRTDGLYFGTIPSGDGGKRFITLTNSHKMPVEVQISTIGHMSKWVTVSRNFFVLQPGESETISAMILVENDVPPGNYTGEMLIRYKRA